MFKGKFKEGDKAEPATWKTRLRCALNKSPDFEEVTDRSQLDISEPYKVYRIVPEEEQKCECPNKGLTPLVQVSPASNRRLVPLTYIGAELPGQTLLSSRDALRVLLCRRCPLRHRGGREREGGRTGFFSLPPNSCLGNGG